MDRQPVVVLLGKSLFLDGVAMGLGGRPSLGVVQMDTAGPDVGERLKSLEPGLIVFELDGARTAALFPLLKAHPGIPLLGLDLDSCQVIVLSSSRHLAANMQALCQLVSSQLGCDK